MPAHELLKAALRDLEADLKHYKVYGTALITLSDESGSEELRAVYQAVKALGCRIPVYSNIYDQHKVPDTGHAVFVIKLTGMVYIQTLVGKLVLPYGSNVNTIGRF